MKIEIRGISFTEVGGTCECLTIEADDKALTMRTKELTKMVNKLAPVFREFIKKIPKDVFNKED